MQEVDKPMLGFFKTVLGSPRNEASSAILLDTATTIAEAIT